MSTTIKILEETKLIDESVVRSLQVGDIVEFVDPMHSKVMTIGPLSKPNSGSLYLGNTLIRNNDGDLPFHLKGVNGRLIVLERAKHPFYANHTKTEPDVGDVVWDPNCRYSPRVFFFEKLGWYDRYGKQDYRFAAFPIGAYELLIDGATGKRV